MSRRSQLFTAVDRNIDVDESQDAIKNAPGVLFGLYIFNKSAAVRYVRLYNTLSANVTVGTTIPVLTIPIGIGVGIFLEFEEGLDFDTAIAIAATTGVADNDTGAPGANDVIVNTFYK